MIRVARHGWIALLLLAGCARDQDYFDVLAEQRAAWNELADVLETVKDEKSMAEAKSALKERMARFEAVSKKAKALPQPSPALLEKAKDKVYLLQRAIDRTREEVRRIQALPGGSAFWKQFSTGPDSLFSAVQP